MSVFLMSWEAYAIAATIIIAMGAGLIVASGKMTVRDVIVIGAGAFTPLANILIATVLIIVAVLYIITESNSMVIWKREK